MKHIQILLIIFFSITTLVATLEKRILLIYRVFIVGISIVALISVIRPHIATSFIKLFGDGLGTDLIIYIGIIALSFAWIHIYSKFRSLNRQLTEIIRELAILNSEEPNGHDDQ